MAQPLRVSASFLSILEIQFWAILCALELVFTQEYEMTLLQMWQGRLCIYTQHVNIIEKRTTASKISKVRREE
jgi:hypothetical protein